MGLLWQSLAWVGSAVQTPPLYFSAQTASVWTVRRNITVELDNNQGSMSLERTCGTPAIHAASPTHAHWGYANALLAQAKINVRIARVLAILSTCAAADDVLRELRRSKHCTGMRSNAWAQATGSDRI
jgi:hypothetical protein